MRLALLLISLLSVHADARSDGQTFDHGFAAYGDVLTRHVKGARVDYRGLVADRATLETTVATLAAVPATLEHAWLPDQRLAFWINAYNLLTLDAIVNRYPIRGSPFSLQPRNSIRQIDGVWTKLRWSVAGRHVTLDDIEHGIIRKELRHPQRPAETGSDAAGVAVAHSSRVALAHFALNCASVSCPPLRAEPYVASRLAEQLDEATRRYLASAEGVRTDGRTLHVSSLFKWYGQDFLDQPAVNPGRPQVERAVLAFLARYGPPDVARLAANPSARLSYLSYDWSLNDIEARGSRD